jgi:AbrB family looped-hinge helix DNA binding protein
MPTENTTSSSAELDAGRLLLELEVPFSPDHVQWRVTHTNNDIVPYADRKLHHSSQSKGQITVPCEVRRALGVRAGDRLVFESIGQDVRVRAVKTKSTFSKDRGIGNPGIGSGRKDINTWLRGLRGE